MIKKYLTLVFLVTLLVSPFGGAYGLTIIPSGGTPYESEDTPFNQRYGGLSPLEITNLQSNDIVYWDGTKWVNASSTSIVDLSTKADINGSSSEDFSIKHLDALMASISETLSTEQLVTTNASVTGSLSVDTLTPNNFTCPGTFVLGTTTPDLGSGTRTFFQSPIQWSCPVDTDGTNYVGDNLVLMSKAGGAKGADFTRWYKLEDVHNSRCMHNIVLGSNNYDSYTPSFENTIIGSSNCSHGGVWYNVVLGSYCLFRGGAANIVIGRGGLNNIVGNNYGSHNLAIGNETFNHDASGNYIPNGGVYSGLCLLGNEIRRPAATSSYYLSVADVIKGYYNPASGQKPELNFYPMAPRGDVFDDVTSGDYLLKAVSMATDVVKIYPKLNLKPQALPTTPDTGDIVIDSGDANKLKYYDGSAWQTGSLVAGIANFAGFTASTTVTIAAQANTNYKVLVTPSENPGGNLGEVWVEKLSTTQFAVHNSGSAVTEFNWGVTP